MLPYISYLIPGHHEMDGLRAADAFAGEGLDQGTRKAPSVLIVEDEHLNALFIAAEFEAAGFTAHIAYDGLEALDILAEHPVDAILTDIRMPNMDGADLVRHLKRSGIAAPVLVMTGVPYEAAELPVEEIFPKPLYLPRVIQAVKACIAKSEVPGGGTLVPPC